MIFLVQRNFVQVARFLEENFPELRGKISGGNYPPPPFIELVSNLVSVIQMIALAWMVLGAQGLFKMLGIQQPPKWALQIEENGIQFSMLLFLILPQFVARFTTTGAFEIYLNDETVFSKLSKGRFPEAEELVSLMVEQGLKKAS